MGVVMCFIHYLHGRLERVQINFLSHLDSADGFYFSHIRMDKFGSYSSHKLGLNNYINMYM